MATLTPAQNQEGLLDYDDKGHRSIYDKGVAPLPIDKFDCEQSQLVEFMDALAKRAHDMGWTNRILKIPTTLPINADTEYHNMLTQHSIISYELISRYENTYVD